jgi:hypothetical protein
MPPDATGLLGVQVIPMEGLRGMVRPNLWEVPYRPSGAAKTVTSSRSTWGCGTSTRRVGRVCGEVAASRETRHLRRLAPWIFHARSCEDDVPKVNSKTGASSPRYHFRVGPRIG